MNAKTTHSLFLRHSSGLTKSAGIIDVLIYNIGLISIGIGITYTHLYGPAHYPGGDITVATLIATVIMLVVGSAFWFWTITFPRSGGIYVFVSRGLSPAIGFALSFMESCCWLFYNSVAGVLISTVGLAPFFSALGKATNSQRIADVARMLELPHAQFLFGAVLIIASGLLLISGMRKFFLIQKIMFMIAIIGTLIMILCLALYSRETFILNFNHFMAYLGTDAYDEIIRAAQRAGLPDLSFDWWQTLRLSVWPFLPLIGGAFSISIGGEVRQVEKGQAIGMLGSIAVCGAIFALVGHLSYRSIGYEFQSAVTYNSIFNVPEMHTPTTPYFILLLNILVNNLIITVIFAASFLAWIYFWVPGILAYTERSLIAWSFDRLTPDALSSVSTRYHTPVAAIMIPVMVSLIFLYLYVYTTFFATLVFILAAAIVWLITTITGIFLPYRLRTVYERSPASYYHVRGLPLMSIMNFLASLGLLIMVVLLFTDPAAAGYPYRSLAITLSIFGVGIILYYITKFIRKRQGIDITLAFKEISID